MNDKLILAYIQDLNVINEDTDLGNDSDDLTEENTTTIDEEENQNSSMFEADDVKETDNESDEPDDESDDDDDEDGWSEEIQSACGQLLDDFDGFAYELRNCKRGSYTDAKTGLELSEFLENLLLSIKESIEIIKTLKK